MNKITTNNDRDGKTGRFLSGCKPGPGRSVGSRNRLADQFIFDVRDVWQLHGRDVLERIARDEPGTLLKVVASLMPRDIGISVTATVDAADFAANFRAALALLGNEPTMKTITQKAAAR